MRISPRTAIIKLMKKASYNKADLGLTTRRLEALVDGIFAIAMTLLVLSIDVPKIPADRVSMEFARYVRALWPELSQYILAFITLAAFWMGHHSRYRYIKRADAGLLWINILALMFVALIPFTTELVGDYGEVALAARLFEVNMLLAGLAFCWQWIYATRYHRLVEDGLSVEIIKEGREKDLFIPILSIAALIISFFSPSWSSSVYFLVPFLHHYKHRKHRAIISKC